MDISKKRHQKSDRFFLLPPLRLGWKEQVFFALVAKPVVSLVLSIAGEPLVLLTPTPLWLVWVVSTLTEPTTSLIVLLLIGAALVTSVEPGPFTLLPAAVVVWTPLIAERRRGTTPVVVLVEVFTSAMISLVAVETRSVGVKSIIKHYPQFISV